MVLDIGGRAWDHTTPYKAICKKRIQSTRSICTNYRKELHATEASIPPRTKSRKRWCDSFGDLTLLRHQYDTRTYYPNRAVVWSSSVSFPWIGFYLLLKLPITLGGHFWHTATNVMNWQEFLHQQRFRPHLTVDCLHVVSHRSPPNGGRRHGRLHSLNSYFASVGLRNLPGKRTYSVYIQCIYIYTFAL